MTEQERLKRICQEIGYNYDFIIGNPEGEHITYGKGEKGYKVYNDVREIIFTTEFKNAFEKELKNRTLYTDERQNQIDNGDRENYVPDEQIEIQCDYAMFGLLDNLNDPVTYLYNLLDLGQN